MISSTSENLLSPYEARFFLQIAIHIVPRKKIWDSPPPLCLLTSRYFSHSPGSNFVFLVFFLRFRFFDLFSKEFTPYPQFTEKFRNMGRFGSNLQILNSLHFCPPLSKGLRCSIIGFFLLGWEPCLYSCENEIFRNYLMGFYSSDRKILDMVTRSQYNTRLGGKITRLQQNLLAL